MRILGVSCDYHDAAAALVVDGEVVAAAEQERFSRVKHDASLPAESIASCLAVGGVDADSIDAVVVHEKPLLVTSRVLAAHQRRGPRSVASFAREFPVLLRRNLMIAHRIDELLRHLGARRPPRAVYSEHHLSHAAAAFLPSPFDSAAILTVDGIGEWSTATLAHGRRGRIEVLEELRYPSSLGLLYSLATTWCGFEANDGEYKLMGLAPYGTPRYAAQLRDLVELHEDGSIRLDARAVRWWGGDPARSRRLVDLFDGPPRRAGDELTQREADLARSVQDLTEEAVLRMAGHAVATTGEERLCLAGGVALNCVANGRLLREGVVDELWVQPAAGDAGSAVGAALWYWHDELRNARDLAGRTGPIRDGMGGAALGPAFDADEVAAWLSRTGVEHLRIVDPDERCRIVARHLAGGAIVGWFEGRMEFGPRALGHRSILADPRSPSVQSQINLRVKGRESFRPFAPAVLWEHAPAWFDLSQPSPYMLLTCQVAADRLVEVPDGEDTGFLRRVEVPRSQIPACTHVDGSARVQTVHRETSPAFHRLIGAFHDLTGCPVLLNTSFTVAGAPIVCTPDDALDTARRARLDVLVIEDAIVVLDRGRSADEAAA